MCVCICKHVFMPAYMCVFIHEYVHTHAWISIHMYASIQVCICMHIIILCAYMSWMCVSVCICVYVFMYAYMCVFIHECLPVGFPGGSDGKQSACNVGRLGLDPWVRKIRWRRAWKPTPVFLPGESHGQRSLVGYSPWGHKESDMTEQLTHTCVHVHTWLCVCMCISICMYACVIACEKRQLLSSAIGRSCCPCRIWRQRQPLFFKLQQLTSPPGLPLGPEDQTLPPLWGEPGPSLLAAAAPSPGRWLSGSWHVGVLLVWRGCPKTVWPYSHNPWNEACGGTSPQPLLTTTPALIDPRHQTM